MGMEAKLISGSERAEVHLSGRFDMSSRQVFLDAMETVLASPVRELRFDFVGLDFIDSSALGALLLARERAGKAGKPISIANPRGSVRRALDRANFGRLFAIE